MIETVAITRDVSPRLAECELTHLERVPIDVDRARVQHAAYQRVLADAGCRIERLPAGADMPDCVFVEDIALVVDELAVITRPGAASRQAEVPAVADALAGYRELRRVEAPATVDGGDVLVAGRRVFVGRSSRTNGDAARALQKILGPFGYTICELAVGGCLHLKSAATSIADGVLLVNPEWIDTAALRRFELVAVDRSEPSAANALRLEDRVVASSAFPRTADRIRARGLRVETVDVTELAKAEGAVTCCSLIVRQAS